MFRFGIIYFVLSFRFLLQFKMNRYVVFVAFLAFSLNLSLIKKKNIDKNQDSVFVIASGKSSLDVSDGLVGTFPTIPPESGMESIISTNFYDDLSQKNLFYQGDMSYICSLKIGSGADFLFGRHDFSVITGPIFVDEKMIIADAKGVVRAYNLSTNNKEQKTKEKNCGFKLAWTLDTSKINKSSIDYNEDRETLEEKSQVKQVSMVYVEERNAVLIASFSGIVALLDISTGKEIWSTKTEHLFRSAPIIVDKNLYVQTSSDEIVSMQLKDGSLNFISNMGKGKISSMKKPSLLLYDNFVLGAGADSEIFSINLESGRPAWAISVGFDDIISQTLNDISVKPIKIMDRFVLAGATGSGMALLDLKAGRPIWKREYSTISDFILFANFVYFIDKMNNVICLHWPTGDIKWHTSLPYSANIRAAMYFKNDSDEKYKKGKVKRGSVTRKIMASGPMMINGQIHVFFHNGKCFTLDKNTGEVLNKQEIPWFVTTRPSIFDGNMYFVNQRSGKLFIV